VTHYRWEAARSVVVKRTQGMEQLAGFVRDRVGPRFPLTHVDDPFALQFYLGTMRPIISFERAAELLRSGTPVFVVVRDVATLKGRLGPNGPTLYTLARWPESGEPFVQIVSNYPRLEWPPGSANE